MNSPFLKLIQSLMTLLLAFVFIASNSCVAGNKQKVEKNIPIADSLVGSILPGTIDTPSVLPGDLVKMDKNSNGVFAVVDAKPEFPGGYAALKEFIAVNAKYLAEAHKQDLQGVICTFVVMKDGIVKDVDVMRGVDPLLDVEAVRLLKSIPKWNPGMIRGKAVNARVTLPIIFHIRDLDITRDITLE